MLEIGSKAPNVALLNDAGETVSLASYAGKYVVLYAYPKDNTSGCTAEACSFRDQSTAITALGAVIVGISPDSVASHVKFKQKHELNFTLLSDPDSLLLNELGAWGEKSLYGKTYMGVLRSTFIFDPEGTLIKVWPKVTPSSHGEEIAAYLKELQQ